MRCYVITARRPRLVFAYEDLSLLFAILADLINTHLFPLRWSGLNYKCDVTRPPSALSRVSRVSRVSSLQQNIRHIDPLLAVVAMETMVLTTHWGPWSSALVPVTNGGGTWPGVLPLARTCTCAPGRTSLVRAAAGPLVPLRGRGAPHTALS